MAVNKGGRGKKSPYESKVVRIPQPLEEKVNQLVQDFHDGKTLDDSSNSLMDYLADVDSAISLAKDILKSKKSAKISLQKFISNLYRVNEEEINL